MNKELLKRLYEINSHSKNEKKIRKFIINYINKNIKECDVFTDRKGNVYITKGESDNYPALCAHMDEVHNETGRRVIEVDGIMFGYSLRHKCQVGIGADDKNGIWIALEALKVLPAMKVVFTVQEEIGCVGASAVDLRFFSDCAYILECDRRGNSDLITSIGYGRLCSQEFEDDVLEIAGKYGYSVAKGMMTDVLEFTMRDVGISCVNISCGYYDPHMETEYTVLADLNDCLDMVLEICAHLTRRYEFDSYVDRYEALDRVDFKCGRFDYKEKADPFSACNSCSEMDCANCKVFDYNGNLKYGEIEYDNLAWNGKR